MKNEKHRVSFVVPVYNEEGGIEDFVTKLLVPEIEKLGLKKYEVLLVNDGSQDKSLEILKRLAGENKNLKIVSFVRNFGKEAALTAGLRMATGDAVIMVDADGQQPPSLIGEFLARWENGAEVVTGVRGKFEKHGLIAKIGSKLFYKILRMLGAKHTVQGSTDYRLLSRGVVDEFNKLTEHDRITRGLIDWMGFPQEYVYYKYGNRMAGRPSYNFRKLLKLAIDSFVSMSTTPLAIFGWVGLVITLLSGLVGLFVIIEMGIMGDPMQLHWTGPTMLAIFITFLVGLLMVSQAITALYISHIHTESRNRPLYIIDKKSSIDDKKD